MDEPSIGALIDGGWPRGQGPLLDPPGEDASGHQGGSSARLALHGHTVPPMLRSRRDEPSGVGWKEPLIVAQVEPLRVPVSMIRHQPSGDVLAGFLQVLRLQHQVEDAGY